MNVSVNADLRCKALWVVDERRATWLQSIYPDSLSLSLGDLHGPSPVPAGAAGARWPSEWWGRAWPVGQPLLGAPVRYKWWWGALQHPGSPVHAKEPNCSGSWPAPRLPHLLFCPASLPLPLTNVFFLPSLWNILQTGQRFFRWWRHIKKISKVNDIIHAVNGDLDFFPLETIYRT